MKTETEKSEKSQWPRLDKLTERVTQLATDVKAVVHEMRRVHEDLEVMATAIASYRDRDRLLRKIILRLAPISVGKNAPEYVRDLLVEAGMISGEGVKNDD